MVIKFKVAAFLFYHLLFLCYFIMVVFCMFILLYLICIILLFILFYFVFLFCHRCDGTSRCEMGVDHQLFGEPCPDTPKYLEVYFGCYHQGIRGVPQRKLRNFQQLLWNRLLNYIQFVYFLYLF